MDMLERPEAEPPTKRRLALNVSNPLSLLAEFGDALRKILL